MRCAPAAREEGLREGREEALAALAPALEALEPGRRGRAGRRSSRAPSASRRTPSTWRCSSPRRSLGGALAVQPELVVEAVRGALRGIVERERVTVLVHPEDLELVRDAMDDVRASLGGIEHCEVQAERRVSPRRRRRPHARTATSTPASRPSSSAPARSSRPRSGPAS